MQRKVKALRSSLMNTSQTPMIQITVCKLDSILVGANIALTEGLNLQPGAAYAQHVKHLEIDFQSMSMLRGNLDLG